MNPAIEVALSWLAVGLTAAMTFGVFMRKREQEEREREADEAPAPAEACTDEDALRPGWGYANEDEDHRLDDPRHGQARELNRRYQ